MINNIIFQNYHRHSHCSNIITTDSAVTNEAYAKRAVELGHNIICSLEHGWQGKYFEVFGLAKKYNLKFIFGVEAYWVINRLEKDKTNNHIVILAKNENGRKAINRILSEANITGYYYKPRVDVELLLSLPANDVFITTACLGFWNYGLDNTEEIILKLYKHFGDNFMLEVQYHNTDKQRKINESILKIKKDYGIKIIMGCDSHYIYTEEKKDRDYVLESKNIFYADEEGWYMDYPSGETAYQRFISQGVLDHDKAMEAINNTNVILSFDDIEFDKNIKMPSLYPSCTQLEKNNIYKELVVKGWNDYKQYVPTCLHKHYVEEIKKEVKTVIDTAMADYFILDYFIVKNGKKNGGVVTYTGRGSGSSFITNKLLGFTNIDRIQSPIKLYPERFMSTSRILESKSLPDLDMNLANVEPFTKAQSDLLGENNSFPMIAFGTFKAKSAFKMYAKANNISFDIANAVTSQIDKYEKDLKYADEEEKDLINIYDYVDKEYYKYIAESEVYRGIISDKKPHPCAYLLYDKNIKEELGIIRIKSKGGKKERLVTVVDGATAEEYKFLKNDLLTVDVVNIIDSIYKKIGIKQHTINELAEITKNDKKTWDIYAKGLTLGINQMSSRSTTEKVKKYAPKNISELTAFIAAIRPAFSSMLRTFMDRKKFIYGIKAFDKLLQTEDMPNSFVLYQEQLMATLQYAGFKVDETYSIIKSIAKKHPEKVLPLKTRFLENFTKKILDQEDISIDEANEMSNKVWRIIEDSCSYGFNASHAYSYAFDSLYCAYLKANYPLEFYCTMLNIYTEKGDKDKVSAFKQEMDKGFGIKTGDMAFGLDNRLFTIDYKNNCINPTLQSIKGVGTNVADNIYNLSLSKKYISFVELLNDIQQKSICDIATLKSLTTLNYFKVFGKNQKLLCLIELFYKKLKNKNLKCSTREARIIELKNVEQTIEDKQIGIKDQIEAEIKLLGYATTKYNLKNDVYIVTDINKKYTPVISLYNVKNGKSTSYKCKINDLEKNEFGMFSIISIKEIYLRNKYIRQNNEYVKTNIKEEYLSSWEILM